MERRKILLDADVGIDDAIAMLHLAGRRDVELIGVGSVHGNIPSDLAAVNARRLLELCALDHVPVAIGARRPMAQPLSRSSSKPDKRARRFCEPWRKLYRIRGECAGAA